MNVDQARQVQVRVAALPASPIQRLNMDAVVLAFLMIFLFVALIG